MKVNVNNVSEYGMSKPYIVARICENELWYWGAWDESDAAMLDARECGGIVVFNEAGE